MISESIRNRRDIVGEVSYKGHRFPAEIIAHCVWRYHRLPLSFREVEELMLVRGVIVTYETIRQWCAKFGPVFLAPPPTPTRRHVASRSPQRPAAHVVHPVRTAGRASAPSTRCRGGRAAWSIPGN